MKLASRSKKVLITGIDGFTGIHLEKFLAQKGYEVYGTVVTKTMHKNHLICDIRNRDDIQNVLFQIQPDFIIHLAAISFVGESNASLIYDVNVIGTQNLLDAVIKEGLNSEKIIIASSATVYGSQGIEVLDEAMCPKPVNHYGISKLAMEHIVSTYFDKLNIILVRPFNYTGVGQAEYFLIPKIVKHYQEKSKTIELGNLDVAREFNAIEYVTEVYKRLMENDVRSEIVNLCSGQAIKLLDVIAMMNQVAGYEIEVLVNSAFVRKNEIPILKGSSEKLTNIIGDIDMQSFQITLENMYKYRSL